MYIGFKILKLITWIFLAPFQSILELNLRILEKCVYCMFKWLSTGSSNGQPDSAFQCSRHETLKALFPCKFRSKTTLAQAYIVCLQCVINTVGENILGVFPACNSMSPTI